MDPKPSVHKPHNSLAHSERISKPIANEPIDKHFADLRLKLGDKRSPQKQDDQESLPSDLSNDEWVEIVNYQKEQFD